MSTRSRIDRRLVVNATEPLTLTTTHTDAAGATPGDPSNCVFARGLKRALHCGQAHVYATRVMVESEDGTHWVRYRTPSDLRVETVAFDRGAPFVPQTFTLPVLPPSKLATGKRQGGESTPKTGRTWKPRKVLENVRPRA
jgi:hypothetical protein